MTGSELGDFASPDDFLNDDAQNVDIVHEEDSAEAPSSRKRPRSDEDEDYGKALGESSTVHIIEPPPGAPESDASIYGASSFGGWGEYMARKRAKLQIQNAQIGTATPDGGGIFKGLEIYINGWTDPSVQVLRELILQHGGVFHAYLDNKALVTHILTCSLTPAKVKEFRYMKVATPAWLVDSARRGVLLPWQDYKYIPGGRIDASQGKRTGQTTISSAFKKVVSVDPQEGGTTSAAVDPFDLTPPFSASGVQLDLPTSSQPGGEGRAGELIQEEAGTVAVTSSGSPFKEARSSTDVAASSKPPPMFTTDPVTLKEAARVPGYAPFKENVNAAKAMQKPGWRAANTAAAGGAFIEGYYKNSRLHHLSMWKAELRELVREAQIRAEKELESSVSGDNDAVDLGVNQSDMSADEQHIHESAAGVSMRGSELALRSPKGKGKATTKADFSASLSKTEDRIILHCDFDCFFVSVGLLDRPRLRGKPVVVCHSQGKAQTTVDGENTTSTSEIASSSYEAREHGVRNGMSLRQAKRLCPDLITIPYEFEKYKKISLQFYTILMAHADDLQAVSVDEALIDVSSAISLRLGSSQTPLEEIAKQYANGIRQKLQETTGCSVSIGISHNIMLARLATRQAKPGGTYFLKPEDLPTFIEGLHIDNLHGFGYAARDKARSKLGTSELSALIKLSRATLCDALGKSSGDMLYDALRGIDRRPLVSDMRRKSVSAEINYGIRFANNEEAEDFVMQLGAEVSRRLVEIGMRGQSITLKVMKRAASAPVEAPKFMGHGICDVFNKQSALPTPAGRVTDDPKIIGQQAWKLLKSFSFDPQELRGIGIQIQKLESDQDGSEKAHQKGQTLLSFKPSHGEATKKVSPLQTGQSPEESIVIVDPTQEMAHVAPAKTSNKGKEKVREDVPDLPPLSQVDPSVLEALPFELRAELEGEYRRRSASPAPSVAPLPAPSAKPLSASAGPSRGRDAQKMSPASLRRITQQLAPRSRASVSPAKSKLFSSRKPSSASHSPSRSAAVLEVNDEELKKLGIDRLVFNALPPELQREQLAGARYTRTFGKEELDASAPKKVIKAPISRRTRATSHPAMGPPAPIARYLNPKGLRQGANSSSADSDIAGQQRLQFTSPEEAQDLVERWVATSKDSLPHDRDIKLFARYLERCVDAETATDSGVECAVAVMRWWRILLRRKWGDRDYISEDLELDAHPVDAGTAWWRAFYSIKQRLDLASRHRFGGSLSIK